MAQGPGLTSLGFGFFICTRLLVGLFPRRAYVKRPSEEKCPWLGTQGRVPT